MDAGVLPLFRTMGRWATNGATMTASWPGSGLLVSFTGPTLELAVTDAPNGSFAGGEHAIPTLVEHRVAAVDVFADGDCVRDIANREMGR